MLSSDVLERQFGPTNVQVLFQDATTRIIDTNVIATGQVLELSWVTFNASGVREFSKVHAEVMHGKSIGKVFRAAGIAFVRENESVTKYELPAVFNQGFGNKDPAIVVEVSILVGPNKTLYAQILETYSPVIDWPEPLTKKPKDLSKRLKQFAEMLDGLA